MGGHVHDIFKNDDIDTRRELLLGIQRLTPANRLAYLRWAARQGSRDMVGNAAVDNGVISHRVRSDSKGEDVHEIYWDVCMILYLGLSIVTAMEELGRMIKRQQKQN